MEKITCYYYVTESNRIPAKEFISSLDISTRKKFYVASELLEEFGHKLSMPHAKYIGNSIFELRFSGLEGAVRILYFFIHNDKAIFTNGFIKKTNKTPKREKQLAQKRRKIYLRRYENDR